MGLCCVLHTEDRFFMFSAREVLENNGIVSVLQDEHLVGTMPFYDMAVAGMKLLVDEQEAERALSLIEGLQVEVELPADQQPEEPLPYDCEQYCPRCHHTEVVVETVSRRGLSLFFFMLFGVTGRLKQKVTVCKNCGHRWKS